MQIIYNICVLWYKKIGMLNIHNWVFSFLSLICLCMLCLKEKYAKKNKSKKKQNVSKMVASLFLGDVGVIGCTSKVIVPIKKLWLCVSIFDFLISQIVIIWDTYALLLCFHTQHTNSLLLLIHVQVQCDLAITGDIYVNICSLKCLNLFLKYKIG